PGPRWGPPRRRLRAAGRGHQGGRRVLRRPRREDDAQPDRRPGVRGGQAGLMLRFDEAIQAWRVVGHPAARTALADPHLDVVTKAAAAAGGAANPAAPTPAEFLASWFSRSPRDQHLTVKR